MHMVEIFFVVWYWYAILTRDIQESKQIFCAKQGISFIGLDIGLPVEDDQPDNHAVVYNANLKHLYDNHQSVAIPIIEKSDLVNNRTATKVFEHYLIK